MNTILLSIDGVLLNRENITDRTVLSKCPEDVEIASFQVSIKVIKQFLGGIK